MIENILFQSVIPTEIFFLFEDICPEIFIKFRCEIWFFTHILLIFHKNVWTCLMWIGYPFRFQDIKMILYAQISNELCLNHSLSYA